jgi:hypothetical protein
MFFKNIGFLVIVSLSSVIVHAASPVNSNCGPDLQKIVTRAKLFKNMSKQASQMSNMAAALSPGKVQSVMEAFTGNRTDKGHIAWQRGYYDGLTKKNQPLDTPRFKPVPNKGIDLVLKQFGVASTADLKNLEGNAKISFGQLKYRIVDSVKDGKTVSSLEQDINQDPATLNPVLHVKLNGVHGKYASVLAKFLTEKSQSQDKKVSPQELLGLSSQIHNIWMDDAAWKVQGVFQKILGIEENQFYNLNSAQRIELSRQALQGNSSQLTADDVAALQQFDHYENLSEGNKRLDDEILYENVQDLIPLLGSIVP